jgi:lysyl-tRNA synthetase class 2
LIFWRSTFKTIAGPQTFSRLGRMTIRTIGSSLLLGFIIVFFDHHIFITAPNFIEALRITIKGFFGISDSYNYASVRTRERTEILLGGLGLVSIVTICWQFFKPFERKVHLDSIDEQMIRHLLDNESDVDSLAYFALRDNKTIIWSRNKKAAVAYSVINGVMITTGDPVGDRESWPDAMERFIKEAEIHAWIPCIYGCSQTAGEIWVKETGFSALEIGDEAIVEVDDFSLDGSAMKNVRQMVARVRRVGITSYTKCSGDLTVDERNKFAKLANEWRRGGLERGFSMALGRFCDERDPNLIISWSEQNGEPIALLQFVPWGSNGLSLDIMRRSENSENGVNEELIVSTIEWAKRNNITKISLNFATFRSIFARGSQLGAGPITKLNYRALKFLSRFAQMESLYRFNAKFRPVWEPRFVVYPGASNLLRVTIAILNIESFLPKFGFSKK